MCSIEPVYVVGFVPIYHPPEGFHTMSCQYCPIRNLEALVPILESKKSYTFACIYAQHRSSIQSTQNKNELSDSSTVSRNLRIQCQIRTSCKDVLAAPLTTNANIPGIKLTTIAASGVCPLFVRPTVSLMALNELLRARKNNVRLET